MSASVFGQLYGNYYHLWLNLFSDLLYRASNEGSSRQQVVQQLQEQGFDAEINRRVLRESLPRRLELSRLSGSCGRFGQESVERLVHPSENRQITVTNGRYYGSGLVIADDATIDDETLDLHSLETQNWWEMLPLIPNALRGKPVLGRGVGIIEAKEVELYNERPRPINRDSARTSKTPALFQVLPHPSSVSVPHLSSDNAFIELFTRLPQKIIDYRQIKPEWLTVTIGDRIFYFNPQSL